MKNAVAADADVVERNARREDGTACVCVFTCCFGVGDARPSAPTRPIARMPIVSRLFGIVKLWRSVEVSYYGMFVVVFQLN